MRVRVVLCVALVLVAGALVLDMSGRTTRTAGSDHITPAVFVATVPAGGVLCQSVLGVPADAARTQMVIGTYGRPVPALRMRFLNSAGAEVAFGSLPAGAHEGPVRIPLRHVPRASGATRACLRIGASAHVAIGGEQVPASPGSASVNGVPQPGQVSLLYMRAGRESWWELLGALARRFGLGKAPFFGTWTLPLIAVLLLGVWIGTARLLVRELT
jgi:hypothetical protein